MNSLYSVYMYIYIRMHVYAGFYTFSGGYIDQPFLERDRSGFVKKTSPV